MAVVSQRSSVTQICQNPQRMVVVSWRSNATQICQSLWSPVTAVGLWQIKSTRTFDPMRFSVRATRSSLGFSVEKMVLKSKRTQWR